MRGMLPTMTHAAEHLLCSGGAHIEHQRAQVFVTNLLLLHPLIPPQDAAELREVEAATAVGMQAIEVSQHVVRGRLHADQLEGVADLPQGEMARVVAI